MNIAKRPQKIKSEPNFLVCGQSGTFSQHQENSNITPNSEDILSADIIDGKELSNAPKMAIYSIIILLYHDTSI